MVLIRRSQNGEDIKYTLTKQQVKEILSDEEKYYFAQEGETNSWRTIDFNNDRKGFGYIFYKNNSDAYIKERMEISSLQNINIIPILNEGYFMCKKGEEIKEEETPKPKSKQSTYKGKSKKKNL